MSPPLRTDDAEDERDIRRTLEAMDKKLDEQGLRLTVLSERLPENLKVRMDRAEQTLAAHKWGLRAVGGGLLTAIGGVLYKLLSGGHGNTPGQ